MFYDLKLFLIWCQTYLFVMHNLSALFIFVKFKTQTKNEAHFKICSKTYLIVFNSKDLYLILQKTMQTKFLKKKNFNGVNGVILKT